MNLDCVRDESRFTVPIRDPVWKHIWLTPEFRDISLTEPFSRLYRIKQLGPTEYIYPGATHTRAAHSFGVYHIALKILRVLINRGADGWVSETGCLSFLAAALLHDLGHFPFTHSLKELPLEDHEILTARLILSEPLKSAVSKAGADPAMTAAIIDRQSGGLRNSDAETVFFRNLLSGVLDPDKLDYLNRDAYYCGVPYGIQDTDFFLSRIQPDRDRGIIVDSRAVMSIESVLFSKYLMYRSVYWHKQVRIATAMMKKTIYGAMERRLIEPETLYPLDDSGIYSLIESLSFPEKEIGLSIRKHIFYQVIAEFSFTLSDPKMTCLEKLPCRTDAEKRVAGFLSGMVHHPIPSEQIIIDIPESVSFESNLFISDEKKIFNESSTVFSADTVNRFTSALRIMRIAIHPTSYAEVATIAALDEKLAKCLELSYTDRQEP